MEILKILEEDFTKEKISSLLTGKIVGFPASDILGEDKSTREILIGTEACFDLDYLFFVGAAFWESIWYLCHVKKMSDGTVQVRTT